MNCISLIDGKTNVFGIIGNPVEHSFSPVLQNTIACELGHDNIYVPFCVKEKQEIQAAINGAYSLGIMGMNITIPYKKEVMEFLCETDILAEQIGAVNTLKRTDKGYKGYNTDIIGLRKSLEVRNIIVEGKTVIITGAGGAANSAAILAANGKAKKIYIVNRTVDNAAKLAERVSDFYDIEVNAMGYNEIMSITNPDILIQTTSVGMGLTKGKSPVEDTGIFKKIEAVLDIIYTPWETRFLSDAKKAGCTVINGFDMLVYQGIASYEIWNDIVIGKQQTEKIRDILVECYTQGSK